jgi:hypothetical protein
LQCQACLVMYYMYLVHLHQYLKQVLVPVTPRFFVRDFYPHVIQVRVLVLVQVRLFFFVFFGNTSAVRTRVVVFVMNDV